MATEEKSPPSISVALVSTTVFSLSSLSRSGPQTWSGATQSWSPPRLRSRSASQSTSCWELAAIRSAFLNSSCTAPRAWVRPASASPSDEASLGNAEISAREESRTSWSASPRSTGSVSIRPGTALVERVPQRVAGVGEVVGLGALDVPLRPARGPLDLGHGQLVGGGLGDPGGQLVGLVDHHDVVLRDHRHALDGVDGEQRVVGDDQLGLGGLLLGALGEALVRERAALGAEAVAVVDRDLPPHLVGVLGRRVPVAGSLGLRLLLGPRPQRQHLAAHGAARHLDEGTLVVGHALADPVQAGVVGAALEDGVLRLAVQHVVGGLEQRRDVALDELVLQGQGRGGDDHAPVVEQGRDEVGQRLAGAGAGLDQQVLPARHRPGDGLGHLDLPGPLLAAERLDRALSTSRTRDVAAGSGAAASVSVWGTGAPYPAGPPTVGAAPQGWGLAGCRIHWVPSETCTALPLQRRGSARFTGDPVKRARRATTSSCNAGGPPDSLGTQ